MRTIRRKLAKIRQNKSFFFSGHQSKNLGSQLPLLLEFLESRVLLSMPGFQWFEVDGVRTTATSGTFTVNTNETFWIKTDFENRYTDKAGGITMSLPYFDGSYVSRSWSSYEGDTQGYRTNQYKPVGSTVYDRNGNPVTTTSLWVEGFDGRWESGDITHLYDEDNILGLRVQARSSPETFYVYVRGWLTVGIADTSTQYNSLDWARYDTNPTSGTWDQQELPCFVYTINVVEPPKPDLIVQDISISPSSPVAGQSVTITATLKNQGTADVNSSIPLNYYVDGNYIGSDSLSFGLDAGQSDPETISFTVNSSGNHSVQVIIDPSDDIHESNENNNFRTETYKWNSPPQPDLDITSVTETSTSYYIGDKLDAKATVKNIGNATAYNNTITYYLGTASDKTYKYITDGSMAGINGFQPDETESDWIAGPLPGDGWTIPDVPDGTYYVWAHITTQSDDSNSDNDWEKSASFTINHRYPDLDVVSVTDTSSIYYIGDELDAKATVKNIGNATAYNNTITYYLGTASDKTYKYITDGSMAGLNGFQPDETESDWIASPLPGDGWTIPDVSNGTYYVWANITTESDDSNSDNNWEKSASFTINHRRPDLDVLSVTDTSSLYYVGDKLDAKATVKNIGNATAYNNTITYYLGTASDKTYKYITDGSMAGINGFQPDETESDWIASPLPGDGWMIPDVPNGTYYVWAHITTQSDDSNSDNDWEKSDPFTIKIPFVPYFKDVKITNVSDGDGDGYARSIDITFDVNSNVEGRYYVKVFEDDFVGDDLLLTSDTFRVDGSEVDYHSISIIVDNHAKLDKGIAEFRLELWDTELDKKIESWNKGDDSDLGGIKLEPASYDTGLPDNKWSIIIHGLSSAAYSTLVDTTGWMWQMAEKIQEESANVVIHSMNTLVDSVDKIIDFGRSKSGDQISPMDEHYHHLLLFDWAEVSNYWDNSANFDPWKVDEPPLGASGEDGYAEGAGDFLYALLQGHNIGSLIHSIIGYSRGAIVASELSQRLLIDGDNMTNVSQVIYLDPEGGGESSQHSSEAISLYDDDKYWAWQGITYTDNYRQKWSGTTLGLGNNTVPGSRDAQVDDVTGVLYSHSNFTDYFIGKDLDLSSGLYIVDGLIVTDDTPDSATGSKKDHNYDSPIPLEIFNGNFEYSDSTAGWWYQGGDWLPELGTFGVVENSHLVLKSSQSRTHNWSYVPPVAKSVEFDLDVISPEFGANLKILWLDADGNPAEEIGTVPLSSLSVSGLHRVSLPAGIADSVGRIKFQVSGGVAAEINLDDIIWSEVTPPSVPDKAIIALEDNLQEGFVMGSGGIGGLTYEVLAGTTAQGGIVAMQANGSFRYTPDSNYNGLDTFEYRAKDSQNALSNIGVVTITVSPINDPPSFTFGGFVDVLEDSPPYAQTWATDMITGPTADEFDQGFLGFDVTIISIDSFYSQLFEQEPSIDQDGILTFTPAPNAYGAATVSVWLQDNGGIANGGQDKSDPITFTITIAPVNDAPTFTKGPDITVVEDSVAYSGQWATDITLGPIDENSQTPAFKVSVPEGKEGLFTELPIINTNGLLTFTPAKDAFEEEGVPVTVVIVDNGGTANGGIDTSEGTIFTITITPVNDPPVPIEPKELAVTSPNNPYGDKLEAEDVEGQLLTYEIEKLIFEPYNNDLPEEIYPTDDEYETYIPSFDPVTGHFILDPKSKTGIFTLEYRAADAQASSDLGAYIIQVGSVATFGPYEKFEFTDDSGDLVTVVFTGPLGSTMETIRAAAENEKGNLVAIQLYGTDAKSILKILTKGRRSETTIQNIESDGLLKAIFAKTTDIAENGVIQINGSLDQLLVDDIWDGTAISTAVASSKGLRIKADEIGDSVEIDIEGTVKMLQADSYEGGKLEAENIGQVKIKAGDFGADIKVIGKDAKGFALNSLQVSKGSIIGSNMDFAGHVRSIVTQALGETKIYLGFDDLVNDFTDDYVLRSLVLKGPDAAILSSTVAASEIKKVKFPRPPYAASGTVLFHDLGFSPPIASGGDLNWVQV